jgi:SAM-dependent methyltransferase
MSFTLRDFEGIIELLVCPNCKEPLSISHVADIQCEHCLEVHRILTYTWELMPSSYRTSSELWPIWEQLQMNGLVSYTHDPEHNLGVGQREDCLDFSRFCKFGGLILDVGCGPQPWPAYFNFHSPESRFVGVDPLVGESPADYVQFRSLGEYLPFRDGVFDHVVFATSLDHFIDPIPALLEARRVCKSDGSIEIWVGEKSPEAPKHAQSAGWYTALEKPELAEDAFHLKRIKIDKLKILVKKVGLCIVEDESHVIGPYRKNYFCKLSMNIPPVQRAP